jgi:hypothetical protein
MKAMAGEIIGALKIIVMKKIEEMAAKSVASAASAAKIEERRRRPKMVINGEENGERARRVLARIAAHRAFSSANADQKMKAKIQ